MRMIYLQLLNEPKFRAVDKIKTIGSTYMGAIGLMPEYKIQAVRSIIYEYE